MPVRRGPLPWLLHPDHIQRRVAAHTMRIRSERKWSQKRMADEIGVSQSFVSSVEGRSREAGVGLLYGLGRLPGESLSVILYVDPEMKWLDQILENERRLLEPHGLLPKPLDLAGLSAGRKPGR